MCVFLVKQLLAACCYVISSKNDMISLPRLSKDVITRIIGQSFHQDAVSSVVGPTTQALKAFEIILGVLL